MIMRLANIVIAIFLIIFCSCNSDKKKIETRDESVNVDWKVEVTSVNHSIAIKLEINPTIKGQNLSPGDTIGVFYKDDIGRLRCGGKAAWTGISNVAISAFGRDETINVKNGFSEGESFNWIIKRASDGKSFLAKAEYESGPNNFVSNGLTILKRLYVP